MRNTPTLDRKYWLALFAASVFGTNTGDFVANSFHLGHLAGLPVLLVLFAAVLLAERNSRSPSAAFFWGAIIVVRTAATNVGDAFKDFHIGFAVSVPVVTAAFAIAVAVYARRGSNAAAAVSLRVDASYWTCMMLAGVLGTLGGDFASSLVDKNHALTAVAVGALAVAAIAWTHARRNTTPYWTAVALVRIAGTAGGDAFAHQLGLNLSTALTGAVFVALVIWCCSTKPASLSLPGLANR